MLFRDLTGIPFVDGRGKPQSFHCRPFRDWVNRGLYKTVPFHEFDRYPLRKQQMEDKINQSIEADKQIAWF
jgi:hypothetical protein